MLLIISLLFLFFFLSNSQMEENKKEIDGILQEIPKYTIWENIISCGPCQLTYFPDLNSYFLNEWEVKPLMPLFCLFLYFSSLYFGIYYINLRFFNLKIIFLIIFCFCFILLIITFFLSMLKSPGYLPFYWAVDKKENYTFEEQLNGIIVNEIQYNFANTNKRPIRVSLSKIAKRFIFKADHFCTWVANWIGYFNYRYFYSYLIYNLIYFLLYFIIIFQELNYSLKNNNIILNYYNIIFYLFSILNLIFFILLLKLFLFHTKLVINNFTTLDFYFSSQNLISNPYDLGWKNNCIETFGDKNCFYCWFCPISIKNEININHWNSETEI